MFNKAEGDRQISSRHPDRGPADGVRARNATDTFSVSAEKRDFSFVCHAQAMIKIEIARFAYEKMKFHAPMHAGYLDFRRTLTPARAAEAPYPKVGGPL